MSARGLPHKAKKAKKQKNNSKEKPHLSVSKKSI